MHSAHIYGSWKILEAVRDYIILTSIIFLPPSLYKSIQSYYCNSCQVGLTLTLALLPCVPNRKFMGIILKHKSRYVLCLTVS